MGPNPHFDCLSGPPSGDSHKTTVSNDSNCDNYEDGNTCASAKSDDNQFNGSAKNNFKGEDYETFDFDSAIQITGYGIFHYKIFAVCALCLLINGLQNGLSSYVFPAAQCDLNLSAAEIGYLNVSFLVGGVCSSFLWGAIADLVGRRRVLLYTILLDAVFTLAGALQQHYLGLCICRFVNGFLIGAAGSITFNYVSEFHAPKHRSQSVCYAGVFYTSAWLLLPILSFLILPLPATKLGGMSAWRLFLAVVAIPELLAGLCLVFLPESPKYAAEKDRDKALRILSRMYAANRRCDVEDYPVKQLRMGSTQMFDVPDDVVNVLCVGKVKRLIGEMIIQIQTIFCKPLVYMTALISFVMFCNMFGYFGLGLWLPELFMRFEKFQEQFPNKSASVQDLASMSLVENVTCVPDFNGKLFRTTLSIGASSLLGNLVSGWLSGKLALRVIPLFTMLVGGLSSGVIYWLNSAWQNLLVACIFQTVMATANITIGGVVVELFPTKVSGMALCLTLFVGRLSGMLSNVMFGLFMDKQAEIPIFTVSVVLLTGAVFCWFIPNVSEKRGKKGDGVKLTDVVSKQPIPISVAIIGNNEKQLD